MKKVLVLLAMFYLLIPFAAQANTSLSKFSSDGIDLSKVTLNEKLDHFKISKGKNSKVSIKINQNQVKEKASNVFVDRSPANDIKKSNKEPHRSLMAETNSNDSPDNATVISIGNVYSDIITQENEQKWYVFENDEPGKLTVILQTVQSSSVDYDLHLFKLNEETMTLEEQITSSYGPGINEQLSRIADPGIYFICINSFQGYDANTPFYFLINYSETYDSKEPDDNIWQAPVYTDEIFQNQTLDNYYDVDWFVFQVSSNKTLAVNLTDPSNPDLNTGYQLDIFDQNLNPLASLSSNTHYSVTFQPGVYLLRVVHGSSYNPQQEYTLNITREVARAVISKVDSDPNVAGYVNYGYGYKWRIEHYAVFHGQLLDNNGSPVPHADVLVAIETRLNNKIYTETGLTDDNGNFSISISNIQEAIGEYSWYGPVSIHYYDIIPLVILSNGKTIECNENSLYHFAYSIYHG